MDTQQEVNTGRPQSSANQAMPAPLRRDSALQHAPINHSTPIRNESHRGRGKPRRMGPPNPNYRPPHTEEQYHLPVHNRYEPLWEEESRHRYQSPRPFLGRGRGWHKRGRGSLTHGGKPFTYSQQVPQYRDPPQGPIYRKPQWMDPPHWERERMQPLGPRRDEQEDAGPGEGSKKRRRKE